MQIRVNIFFDQHRFSFLKLSVEILSFTLFNPIAASGAVTNGVSCYVIHTIFNTNLCLFNNQILGEFWPYWQVLIRFIDNSVSWLTFLDLPVEARQDKRYYQSV